jgi:hypothetical protein
MSTNEIKNEINKVLDRFSDKALQDLLSFLKSVESKDSISLLEGENFNRILSEDKELLARLAQ